MHVLLKIIRVRIYTYELLFHKRTVLKSDLYQIGHTLVLSIPANSGATVPESETQEVHTPPEEQMETEEQVHVYTITARTDRGD